MVCVMGYSMFTQDAVEYIEERGKLICIEVGFRTNEMHSAKER
jgi:hypothetical protein